MSDTWEILEPVVTVESRIVNLESIEDKILIITTVNGEVYAYDGSKDEVDA
ncbi:hypothetical protein LCGC14_1042390 [marine sediment metagenome]|uniref:Uncharacterized protein n=1 Tax=marine sediment metagenome TaxID=412755 RepID=A0A0F9QXM8_9ZZZZ